MHSSWSQSHLNESTPCCRHCEPATQGSCTQGYSHTQSGRIPFVTLASGIPIRRFSTVILRRQPWKHSKHFKFECSLTVIHTAYLRTYLTSFICAGTLYGSSVIDKSCQCVWEMCSVEQRAHMCSILESTWMHWRKCRKNIPQQHCYSWITIKYNFSNFSWMMHRLHWEGT